MRPLRLLAPLSLVLLPVLFLWKLTLAGRILVGLDPFNFFYPYHDAVRAALAEGHLPQWNPALFGGVPFLADSQAQLFYPPSWPFLLVSAPAALTWSVTLHLVWAALGLALFGRRSLGLGVLGAWVAGALFVLSGYLGAQVEHVNQVHAASWLPWLLLGYEEMRREKGRHAVGGLLLGCLALAMSLLAGHAQTTFISLVLLGLWVVRALRRDYGQLSQTLLDVHGSGLYLGRMRPAWRDYLLRALGPLLLIVPMGLLLATVQLVPTQYLTALSQRAGGLSLPEVAAFSLDPRVLPRALLPSYGLDNPLLSEYMAWFAVGGGVMALVGLWRGRARVAAHDFGILATITGLLLALGGYNPLYWLLWRVVPGFDLFRVPARWLLLYILGMAVLAGLGVDTLDRRDAWRLPTCPRRHWALGALGAGFVLAGFLVLGAWPPPRVLPLWLMAGAAMGLVVWLAPRRPAMRALLPVLLLVELWFGWRAFALQHATAPEAYSDLRIAPAHLLASQGQPGEGRLLSMSDLTWDPGDLASLAARHAALLGEQARYDLVVSTKLKEVLAPNQPMRWGLATADGYGGGLLPTARWVAFQPVLPLAKIVPDGRLREQLTGLPSPALLDVMGVEWIVADKVLDWWQRDIYHDLGAPLAIRAGATHVWTPPMDEATSLSFVVFGEWPEQPGTVIVGGRDLDLRDAEPGEVRETPRGQEQHFWLSFPEPLAMNELTLQAEAEWQLGGLSMVDERLPGFVPLPADPAIRTTSSGDVKVYRRQESPGRAWLVPSARTAASVEAAAQAVAVPEFDPLRAVVVETAGDLPTSGGSAGNGEISWRQDQPERIELEVRSEKSAWLILADAPTPGWHATVDGDPVEWYAANVINRALFLPAGTHVVQWRYVAPGLRLGMGGSIVGLVVLAGLSLWLQHRPRREK